MATDVFAKAHAANTPPAFCALRKTAWTASCPAPTAARMCGSPGWGETGNKVITLEGKTDCPATAQKDVSMKQVFRVLSQDKHVVEMSHDGQKSMEITYTWR
jgi:hypothetical protein